MYVIGAIFQSTPPARGATIIFFWSRVIKRFQSTPPARGVTTTLKGSPEDSYISIHAPREGGDDTAGVRHYLGVFISIHAPREGGDYGGILDLVGDYAISIHAPREGGDREI